MSEVKYFTVEEANKTLPLMRKIVQDIRETWDQIIRSRGQLEQLEREAALARDQETRNKLEKSLRRFRIGLDHLITRINRYVKEVEDLGCFMEEFKRGIVNFPTLRRGRKVFLCWMSTEDESVSHWHELDEGANDRVPIRDASHFLNEEEKVFHQEMFHPTGYPHGPTYPLDMSGSMGQPSKSKFKKKKLHDPPMGETLFDALKKWDNPFADKKREDYDPDDGGY